MSVVQKTTVMERMAPRALKARLCMLCLVWAACDPQRLISAMAPAPSRQFGHGARHAAAFSPDGRTVLLAGSNAQLFDLETGTLLRQFLGHSDLLTAADFFPDGNRIATSSRDGTARFWNVETGAELARLEHPDAVAGMALSPDGEKLATVDIHRTGRIWDIASQTILNEFQAETSIFGAGTLAYSPDGEEIAAAASGGAIVFRDADTYQELGRIETGIHPVNGIAFSPDGGRIVAALGDSATMTARLYDRQTQEVLWTAGSHTNAIFSVGFSPDGDWIATGSLDWTTRIWDADTGEELRSFPQPLLSATAISPDSRLLISSGAGSWDARAGELNQVLQNQIGKTSALAVSPDGEWILTGNADDAARLWESASGRLIHTFTGHTGRVQQVAFSPDGTTILTASVDGTVKWWDSLTRAEARSMKFPPGVNLAISSDQRRLLTSNSNQNRVFDLHSGEEIHMFSTFPGALHAPMAFSPDGTYAVVTDAGRNAKIVLTETGEEARSIDTGQQIVALEFSPDGTQVLAVGMTQAAVWEAATGQRVGVSSDWMRDNFARIGAAVFSPGGKEVLTLRDDGFVFLWNLESGKLAGMIENKGQIVFPNFAAFSPDGNWIFVGNDSALLMWERKASETVVPLRLTHVVERFQASTILRVEGPATRAFRVFAQSRLAWSPASEWEEEGQVMVTRHLNSSELRFPWRPGPQRFFRAYVLPLE
jgi:WD40 repeat protein